MDLVTCNVKINRDTVVHCGPRRGVTVPELAVLYALHGTGNVSDVEVIGTVASSPQEEKGRLSVIYDPALVDRLYPGVIPQMQMTLPGPERIAPPGKKAKAEVSTENI